MQKRQNSKLKWYCAVSLLNSVQHRLDPQSQKEIEIKQAIIHV